MGEPTANLRGAFKKPAPERSQSEKTYASKTTKRRATASASLRTCFQTAFHKFRSFDLLEMLHRLHFELDAQ